MGPPGVVREHRARRAKPRIRRARAPQWGMAGPRVRGAGGNFAVQATRPPPWVLHVRPGLGREIPPRPPQPSRLQIG